MRRVGRQGGQGLVLRWSTAKRKGRKRRPCPWTARALQRPRLLTTFVWRGHMLTHVCCQATSAKATAAGRCRCRYATDGAALALVAVKTSALRLINPLD